MVFRALMAVDGSEYDEKTAQFLARLLGPMQDQAAVMALYVAHYHLPVSYGFGSPFDMPSLPIEVEAEEQALRAEADSIVARVVQMFQERGIAVDSEVAWGGPADTILKRAEQGGYDVIALGSRGAGGLAGLVLGSVSDRVAHRSKVPVLIVH